MQIGSTQPRTSSGSRTWTRRSALVAALAAPALVATGCASASRERAAGGGATATQAQEAADGTLPLRFISTGATFTDLPTVVILAQGYFEQVGLDVEFSFGASNASLVTQAVITGDADVATSGTGALYSAYAEGKTNLVSMGTSNPSICFGIALNSETVDQLAEQGVTPDSSVEDRVNALRGLSIAASPEGSTGNTYVQVMLREHGLDPATDVTLVPNNDFSAQIAATRQTRTNGFAQSYPRANFPEAEGWGSLWLNWSVDLPTVLPLAAQDYYTTREWLAANAEAASRLMQALWLAHQDLQDPGDELRDAVRALPDFADFAPDAFNSGWELAVSAYEGATPITTEEMFGNSLELLNYGRDAEIQIAFDDIYDLSAAEAGQP